MRRCLKYSLVKNFTGKTNRQTNGERKPFFLFEPHLGDACTGKEDSLSYIFILQEEKREGLGGVIMPAFCSYENICKLKTQEPQVRCKWNLLDICTTSTPFISKPFISKKVGVAINGQARGVFKKPPKNATKLTNSPL